MTIKVLLDSIYNYSIHYTSRCRSTLPLAANIVPSVRMAFLTCYR